MPTTHYRRSTPRPRCPTSVVVIGMRSPYQCLAVPPTPSRSSSITGAHPSGNSRQPLHVTLPNLCIPVARRMAASATSWELRAGASDSSCASLLEHCSGAIDHSVGRMRFRGFTAVVMGHTNHQACAPDQSRPDAL